MKHVYKLHERAKKTKTKPRRKTTEDNDEKEEKVRKSEEDETPMNPKATMEGKVVAKTMEGRRKRKEASANDDEETTKDPREKR